MTAGGGLQALPLLARAARLVGKRGAAPALSNLSHGEATVSVHHIGRRSRFIRSAAA
jgi:hypothetical protein